MKRFDIPLLLLLAISVCGNAFLGYQNVRLREARPKNLPSQQLAIGSVLTSLVFNGDMANQAHLQFPSADRPILIYAVSGSCKWCASNAEKARALEAITHLKYQFITLCMDGDLEGCRSKTGNGPLYEPTPEAVVALKLGSVPQTIVVSSLGRVEKVWTGAFTPSIQEELEAHFGATLSAPDCDEESGGECR